jgi:hypothetical protein
LLGYSVEEIPELVGVLHAERNRALDGGTACGALNIGHFGDKFNELVDESAVSPEKIGCQSCTVMQERHVLPGDGKSPAAFGQLEASLVVVGYNLTPRWSGGPST